MSFTKLFFYFGGIFSVRSKISYLNNHQTYSSTVTLLLVAMDHILAKVVRLNNKKKLFNWPPPTGAFQDQCKQTMKIKYSNKHNQFKNPNCREADQLAIHKSSSSWSERDLNPRPTDFKFGALTTRPCCLHRTVK